MCPLLPPRWDPGKCSLSSGSSFAWVTLTSLNNVILKDFKYFYEHVGCWELSQLKSKSELFQVMGIINMSLKNMLARTGRKLSHIYLHLAQTQQCRLQMFVFLFRVLNFRVHCSTGECHSSHMPLLSETNLGVKEGNIKTTAIQSKYINLLYIYLLP